MNTDYMYSNDIIYSLSDDVKLLFHTVASYFSNNKVYSNYNEYRINSREECNTMIKRNFSYYIYFEDKRNPKSEKVYIYPEDMFELLSRFDHIKRNWIDNDNMGIYGYIQGGLRILNHEEIIIMKLPFDKIIKITPGIMLFERTYIKCIDLYLNSNNPIQITVRSFNGLYYTLNTLDMCNFANTTFSTMMLMNVATNRTDFSIQEQSSGIESDKSKANGTSGRTFEMYERNKSFFDKN